MERQAQRPHEHDPIPGPEALFTPAAADRNITIVHGAYCETLPASGMSLSDFRRLFADRFDLDPDADAFLDGEHVSGDATLRAGQTLLFSRRAGEKGRAV